MLRYYERQRPDSLLNYPRRTNGKAMCNNYRLHAPASQLAAPFRGAGQALAFPGGLPNLAPTDYRIGDSAPIVTLGDG